MPEQFSACAWRESLTFDKGVVSNGGAQCFAPAQPSLHCLAGRSHCHGVEPPAFLRGKRLPVAQRVRDIIWCCVFHSPAENTEFLTKRWMYRHRISWIF